MAEISYGQFFPSRKTALETSNCSVILTASSGQFFVLLLALSYTGFSRLVLLGEGTKCPRPFSLKRLKLQQSNLVH